MMTATTSDHAPIGSPTDELRNDILTGHFLPGDRLQEVALAERYRCGRSAVRSALVELTTEGLVEREANRGARVRRISVDEAVEITEARAVLEELIAARAARNATEADRAELTRIVADMRHAVGRDEAARYSALNGELHQRLLRASGHGTAAELVANLRNRAVHHQFRLAMMPGRPDESLDQHAAIVEAVVAGDEAAAGRAMRIHLASVLAIIERWGDATT